MWIIDFAKKSFVELLFPSFCALCNKPKETLCAQCLKSLKLSVDIIHPETYSHFSYKDPNVRLLLKKIKYYHRPHLLEDLVREVFSSYEVRKMIAACNNPLLIPIPTPLLRVFSRGENHTKNLAKIISNHLNLPVENNLLVRRKHTKQQVKTLSKKERQKNVRNIFQVVTTNQIDGRRTLILIDDVTTTGATLEEARRILKQAGYNNVKAITLAH
jgi:competence protein ComFC